MSRPAMSSESVYVRFVVIDHVNKFQSPDPIPIPSSSPVTAAKECIVDQLQLSVNPRELTILRCIDTDLEFEYDDRDKIEEQFSDNVFETLHPLKKIGNLGLKETEVLFVQLPGAPFQSYVACPILTVTLTVTGPDHRDGRH